MSHIRVASLAGVALCGLAGTAFAQSAEPRPPRVGFEGGFGLYGGEIHCENENGDFCDGVSEAGGIDLHLNYFFNPTLGIFGDVFVMGHTEDDWTLTHSVVTAGLKWRPLPILTLAAGLGSAQARWRYDGIVNLDAETDTVPAVMFAAGLEVLRGKSFALDLQARIGVGFYDEDENNNGEADIKGSNVGFGAALTWF
ncbi:MAG TPA: hypothetical protein VM261_25070 [Kofleriaceae bacterium]|nr:hypothetical protein [Kofleriaceae bacterium]